MDNSKQLLDLLIAAFREEKFKRQTAQVYLNWVKLFLHYYKKRTSYELGAESVKTYLQYLAKEKGLMPSRQKEAFEAISFFYTRVLRRSMWSSVSLGEPFTKSATQLQPSFLAAQKEDDELIPDWTNQLLEPFRTIARLKYECGLKYLEVLNIRVEDVDLDEKGIYLRDPFGELTMMQVSEKTLRSLVLQKNRALNSLRQDEQAGNVYFSNPHPLSHNSLTNQSRWYLLFPGSLRFNMNSNKKIRTSVQLNAVIQAIDEAKKANRQATKVLTSSAKAPDNRLQRR